MEEIKEINEDIIRLKEAMNMIREREKSIKEQKEALEDETRIVKAQREEQKIAKAEEDLKEFKDLTIEIILRMANKVKEIRKTAQMQYIKDSVNAVRAVQERKNLQNKRIKLLNKKNAELNNDKLTETERARKEKFIEAISIKIENEQKEIDGLPNVKKVEENWKKTSDDLNNAEETLNKYRLILLGIRVQTQNEYEQDEPTPNRPVQGEPMPNRPVPGESTPSEPVQDEQEQGEPTPSEPVQDEQAQDEPTQGEPAQGEPAQEEQAQGEPAPSRPAQGESTPSEPVQDEQEQGESTPSEPVQDEQEQGESTPSKPAQDEQEQDEPAQGEPTPNRPVQGEPTPSEPVQDEQAQGEPTPSEPVQGEQEQDEPVEQPELVDKAIIRATEEVRRKTMELKALKQMYDKMYDKYDRLIVESESAEERKEAEGYKEEIMKVWETWRKKAKELEDNYGIYALDSLETMSAIICGNYNEDVKDGIRRWSVLRDKGIEMRKHYKDLWNNGRYSEAEQYFENSGLSTIRQREDLLRDKAFQRLTEEEKSKISDIYSKGYIGGVNIDLENDEISVLVGDNSRLKIIQRRYYPKKGEIEQTKRGILEKYGIKMKRREIRNLDLQILDALEAVAIKDDKNPSEEDITALKEYITAYHKSLTDNPDRPRIAIAYNGEKINEKSFNASKKYMRQAQKFGGTIPEGCDVRTPWQKFIDFLKKPKMIEEGDGKEESEQQGEQTDEKTPQGGQAAKDFRDRNHDEKAAATVGETAQQNAQKAQEAQDRTEGNAEQEK